MKKIKSFIAGLASIFAVASCSDGSPGNGTTATTNKDSVDYLYTVLNMNNDTIAKIYADKRPRYSEDDYDNGYKISDKITGGYYYFTPQVKIFSANVPAVQAADTLDVEYLVTAFDSKLDTVWHVISDKSPNYYNRIWEVTDAYTGENRSASSNNLIIARPVQKARKP